MMRSTEVDIRVRRAWLIFTTVLLCIQGSHGLSLLHARAPQTGPNSCSDGSWTAANGLQFAVQCNTNSPDNDIANVTATDVYDCMNQCAKSSFPCYAAIWDNALYGRCFLKTSNISSARAFTEQNVFMGIANATQLEPLPTACPYRNGSVQTTSQDYKFRVYCGMNLNDGHDLQAPTHTDSLEDCLEQCNTVQPLCLGVTWDPDLSHGFGNCYLKNSNRQALLGTATGSVHTALALHNQTQDFNSSCNDGSTYTSNNKEFTLHCGQDRIGADLFAEHTRDLGACIDLCANYFNSSTGACQAVSFNPDSQKSWANCYLKTAAKSPVATGDFDVAILTKSQAGGGQGAGNGTAPSSDEPASTSSKAWIAGPVVGAVAAIALVVGAFFWLRRRRNRRTAGSGQYAPAGQRDSHDAPGHPMTGVGQNGGYDQADHKHQPLQEAAAVEADSAQVRHELGTRDPQEMGTAVAPQELDASSPARTR